MMNEVYADEVLDTFTHGDDRYITLIDLDAMFATSTDAIILNRTLDYTAKDYVKQRNAAIYSRSGELNFIARCDCGNPNLIGNVNIDLICPICNAKVRLDFSSDDRLEHNTWLGIPNMIPGVLHPSAYIVFAKWLSRKNAPNYIDVILDPSLDLPAELADVITGRGHIYFYENFDRLMAHFLHYYRVVVKNQTKKRNADTIEKFISNYRSVMFCTKLPVMSSVLHSITSSDGTAEGRQYADAGTQVILDAATDLAQLEATTVRTRPSMIPIILQRVYRSYISYIQEIEKNRLSKKKSLIRRHMLGTRLHFSVRTVIIPHMDRYDELYFPWSISVNMLKLHLLGRLMRNYGMSIADAMARQITALVRYDPLIDQIMKDLITECRPEIPGLPVPINRNPDFH